MNWQTPLQAHDGVAGKNRRKGRDRTRIDGYEAALTGLRQKLTRPTKARWNAEAAPTKVHLAGSLTLQSVPSDQARVIQLGITSEPVKRLFS